MKDIRENGKRVFDMAKGKKPLMMVLYTEVNIVKEKKKAKENISERIYIDIMDSLKRI